MHSRIKVIDIKNSNALTQHFAHALIAASIALTTSAALATPVCDITGVPPAHVSAFEGSPTLAGFGTTYCESSPPNPSNEGGNCTGNIHPSSLVRPGLGYWQTNVIDSDFDSLQLPLEISESIEMEETSSGGNLRIMEFGFAALGPFRTFDMLTIQRLVVVVQRTAGTYSLNLALLSGDTSINKMEIPLGRAPISTTIDLTWIRRHGLDWTLNASARAPTHHLDVPSPQSPLDTTMHMSFGVDHRLVYAFIGSLATDGEWAADWAGVNVCMQRYEDPHVSPIGAVPGPAR